MTTSALDGQAVAALAEQPVDFRFKGLPAGWANRTPAEICAGRPDMFGAGPLGPLCVLDAAALADNIATMAAWCENHGVELAPHGKTHMSPQLLANQFDAGACAVTAGTISQARVFRAFGVRDVILANELVDPAGLAWLADEQDRDPDFRLICWVDSPHGVALMNDALAAAGAGRPVQVCVEVGAWGARTGCRGERAVDEVVSAVLASRYLRLAGVAGYEAALGHDVSPEGRAMIRDYLVTLRAVAQRVSVHCETDVPIVTAGGSTHFDLVAEVLAGDWRTILRSGCYLTHDAGLYLRTSPLTRPGAETDALRAAMTVWGQVCSHPESGLALLTMGRRDVSFDQDLPVPQRIRTAEGWLSDGLGDSTVVKLNDQHAFLQLSPTAQKAVGVGTWIEFGVSHPCTVFDKWPMIPVIDEQGAVVDLIRTFF